MEDNVVSLMKKLIDSIFQQLQLMKNISICRKILIKATRRPVSKKWATFTKAQPYNLGPLSIDFYFTDEESEISCIIALNKMRRSKFLRLEIKYQTYKKIISYININTSKT